jgi:predicted N-acetyltransferase YhbS
MGYYRKRKLQGECIVVGPRAAKVGELPLVESLSNEVFRIYDGDGQTMFQEFPDLFCKENIDNVRVIVEDGKPVSNINYLIRTVSIYGCKINVASLGAVATLQDYRGRGYASMLLDDCVNRMINQDAHILLISGDRNLYRNIGSTPAGLMYKYVITDSSKSNINGADSNSLCNNSDFCVRPNSYNESSFSFMKKSENRECSRRNDKQYRIRELDIEQCSNEDLYKLANLYRQENVRFVRHYDKFYELLASRKFLRKKTAQKKVIIIESKTGFEAYFYMVIEGNQGIIYDCVGSRELIINACAGLIDKYELKNIHGRLMTYHKSAISYCIDNNIPLEKTRLIGTIKIVNFKTLMESLRRYFYEIYDNKFIDELEFENSEKGACFKFKEKKCVIADKQKLNDLIFGGAEVSSIDFVNDLGLEADYEVFAEFFDKCFPIPFIDPLSLNYI